MISKKEVGNYGEDLAVKFLIEKGYKIISKNFYIRGGEIDIIAKDKNEYVFVEVKTRTSRFFGEVSDQVSSRQQKKLAHSAEVFLHQNNLTDSNWRIDVIAILMNNQKLQIKHVKHAITHF